MALPFQQLGNSCEFNAVSAGTGDFVVGSATAGRLTPAQSNAIDGTIYTYYAQSADGSQWESGSGSYAVATTTLHRTTITDNSNGDTNPVNFTTPPIIDVFPPPTHTLSNIDAPYDAEAFSNLAINGGMEIDQQNAGAVTTVTSTGYAIDGWLTAKTGTMVCTAQLVADAPPGLTNSLKIVVTTAEASLGSGDFTIVFQRVEGYRTSRLSFGSANAQSVTIGFWSKIHRPGTYSGFLENAAATRAYAFNFTQIAADTWEYKTVTIPGDITGAWAGNTNTVGIVVGFAMAGGSGVTIAPGSWATVTGIAGATGTTNGVAATNDVFQITGVSLLPGAVAPTAAQSVNLKRSLDQELILCQRYLRVFGNGGTTDALCPGMLQTTTQFYGIINFPTMRTIPTGTVSAASDWFVNNLANNDAGTAFSFDIATQSTARVGFLIGTARTAGQAAQCYAATTNARLFLDARL